MVVGSKIGIVYLVTRVCLTCAILTAKASSDRTNIARPWHSYLPVTSETFPKNFNYRHNDRAVINDAGRLVSSGEPQAEAGLQPVLNGPRQKSQTGPQRFPVEIHQNDVRLSTKVLNASPSTTTTTTTTTTKTTLLESRDTHQRHVPRRLAYQDIETLDGYLTEELNEDTPPYHEKPELATYYHRHHPQDITTAIKALDRFLSRTLNDDGYNSKLHPPPNPVLALILSRYGRYVPGPRNPRVYAHMAVNNIHNYQPFGAYKYECDEEPIYTAR